MPAGRPYKEVKAETRVQARCYVADDIRWRADAARAGMDYSSWIRHCLNYGGGRKAQVKPVTPARQPEVIEEPTGRAADVTPEVPARQERVAVAVVREPPPSQLPPSALESGGFMRMRETAKGLAQTNGKCTADVARGTRCKLCAKIH
jgi:hypothetical protein